MNPLAQRQRSGFSIVEMMVALTLGLIIIAAVGSLFVSSKKSYTESERFARLEENARFAIHTLKQEIRLARFLGEAPPAAIDKSSSIGSVSGNCTGSADILDPTTTLVATTADGSGNALGCVSGAVPNSGVIVVKHARPVRLALNQEESNKLYILTYQTDGLLHGGGSVGSYVAVPDCNASPCQSSWEYQASVFYVRNTTPPTLSRMVLQLNAGALSLVREDLIAGIERMVLLFGNDSDKDGDIDSFLSAASVSDWGKIGAVQITLLVRSEEEDPFFTNNKTYNLGGGVTVANPNDHYHRTVISTTVGTRNIQFVIREGS